MIKYTITDKYGNIIRCLTTDLKRLKEQEKAYHKRSEPKSLQWCKDANGNKGGTRHKFLPDETDD
jgi:hypothetical protein